MEDWDEGYVAGMQFIIEHLKRSRRRRLLLTTPRSRGLIEALDNTIEWCNDEIVAKGGEPK